MKQNYVNVSARFLTQMASSQLIRLYEHQKIELSDSVLSNNDLSCIEKLNELHKCEILKVSRKYIKATQYVGFVRIKNKTIQVIPKILKNYAANLHFLLHMLRYTKKLSIKDFSLSNLATFKDDFFEILIWLFTKNLRALIERNMKKSYVLLQENSTFLKGKLLVAEQIRKPLLGNLQHYCQFEEFTENNLLNQILKYTVSRLLIQSCNQQSIKLMLQIMADFVNVELREISLADFTKLHFTRLNIEYKPIIELAKLLLLNRTISLEMSKMETFAFMFDMNKLFEEFIYEFMKNHQTALEIKAISAQKTLGRLFGEFNMYYDILVKPYKGEDILIDTKYKITDTSLYHNGLSESDFYQMYTYASSQPKKFYKTILLYPKVAAEDKNYYHSVDGTEFKLSTRNIDLEKIWDVHRNCLNEPSLIEELDRCLEE